MSITDDQVYGLWYSPYVKVYTIGGNERIVEISNYPRAYKDTDSHAYTTDVAFTVTESDLNHYNESGEFVFLDSKDVEHGIEDTAYHYIGDPLPGIFPLWIEDEDLPFTPDPTFHIFELTKVPGLIEEMMEAGVKVGDSYVKFNQANLDQLIAQIELGELKIARVNGNDKQILRFKYKRGR